MAHKPTSFRLDEKKKVIILYTNETQTDGDKALIQMYIASGYTAKFEVKKPAKTVAQMRKELEKDENALKAFNDAYADKDRGFFEACKIYNAWEKKNKPAKKSK